jgi:hypothetical protein
MDLHSSGCTIPELHDMHHLQQYSLPYIPALRVNFVQVQKEWLPVNPLDGVGTGTYRRTMLWQFSYLATFQKLSPSS